MALRILRKLYNGILRLVTGIMAVSVMYVGGALLLALTMGTQMLVLPRVAPFVPETTDIRLLILLWLVFSIALMLAIGSVLARVVNSTFGMLDSFEHKFSFKGDTHAVAYP